MTNLDTINATTQQASLAGSSRGTSTANTSTNTGKTLPQQQQAVVAEAVEAPSPEQIETAVAKISDFVQSVQRDLSFTVNGDTGDTIITVKDTQTDEVIRQIPSELLVQLAQNLNDLQEKLESTKGNLLEVRV